MMKRSIKRKLVQAKIALHQTIQKILDINRHRKKLTHAEDPASKEEALREELKLLNKLARAQARLVQQYENALINRKFRQRN